jgi:protein-disulfide isomerase
MDTAAERRKITGLWSWLDRLATVAILIAAGIAVWIMLSNRRVHDYSEVPGSLGRRSVQDVPNVEARLGTNQRGHRTARIALVEFAEFQCPFCARHAAEAYPQLERDYINTGIVKYSFRHLPLPMHKSAFPAAVAAECAARRGRFWEIRTLLFKSQASLEPAVLERIAQDAGLDRQPFVECVADRTIAEVIRADLKDAAKLNVLATPTFFLGEIAADGESVVLKKRINGLQPYETFRGLLAEMHQKTGVSFR